jgi:hypothetical protein
MCFVRKAEALNEAIRTKRRVKVPGAPSFGFGAYCFVSSALFV